MISDFCQRVMSTVGIESPPPPPPLQTPHPTPPSRYVFSYLLLTTAVVCVCVAVGRQTPISSPGAVADVWVRGITPLFYVKLCRVGETKRAEKLPNNSHYYILVEWYERDRAKDKKKNVRSSTFHLPVIYLLPVSSSLQINRSIQAT